MTYSTTDIALATFLVTLYPDDFLFPEDAGRLYRGKRVFNFLFKDERDELNGEAAKYIANRKSLHQQINKMEGMVWQ